ncbi:MAG TPA: histidinol-phosphate transaminase [Acidobacteriota bacterium]|nr:histidinol-phosphate transaminase [Acidobacteriota bacterium]
MSSFDLNALVRPNVRTLKPYQSARDSIQSGVLLDANENPYPVLKDGIQLNRYPDPNQAELRRALADYVGLDAPNVLAGAGSDEVLDWIFKVFLQPGKDLAAILEPTYGMYRVQADIMGVEAVGLSLHGEDFSFSASRYLQEAPRKARVAFLCSPNNPTGNLLEGEEVLKLCRDWGKIVVLDEAYVEFADRPSMAAQVRAHPNLVIMRTLSKAFGRAAIRLGYALASPQIIEYFRKVKAPYNLNALTQRQGVLALQEGPSRLEKILSERSRLRRALQNIPAVGPIFASQCNFLLFKVADASLLCRKLLERGVVVRDRSSMPGLADTIRVSIGRPEENDLFLHEFRRLVAPESATAAASQGRQPPGGHHA